MMGLEVCSNMAWEITNRPPTNHLLTTYRPPTNHLLTTYQPPTDHLPTTYQPHTDHVPTTYQPLLTTYRPPTNHLPTTNHFFKVQLVQYFPWLGFASLISLLKKNHLVQELQYVKHEKDCLKSLKSQNLKRQLQ